MRWRVQRKALRRGTKRRSQSAPPRSIARPICYEQNRDALIALMQSEGGKTLDDALAEVREAVDFCRYYAAQARETLMPERMPGPTGETNELHHRGRGVFVCISPWNFPLAIFTGQVVAALAAGNSRHRETRRTNAAGRRRRGATDAPFGRAGIGAASRDR